MKSFVYIIGILLFGIFQICGWNGLFMKLDTKGNSNNTSNHQKLGNSHEALISTEKALDSSLNENIKNLEYQINWDSKKRLWQSPNRSNNIRAYYAPGLWKLQKRDLQNQQSWNLELKTIGVYVDDDEMAKPVQHPKSINKGTQLDIDHGVFSEQYINSKEGVRQNFIIDWAPWNAEELTVKIQYGGMDATQGAEKSLLFSNEKDSIIYNDFKVFDAKGNPLLARMELFEELNEIHLSASIEGAYFPITIDPLVANGNLSNADGSVESNQIGGFMGRSVSSIGDVNGDGYGDVAVGASFYDNGQSDEGVVFIYHGSSTGISTTEAILLESNQASSEFGNAIAYAGDVNGDGYGDLIVGAKEYDNGQSNEGVAFIYHGSASGLSSTHNAILEINQANAQFGFSVAGGVDVNGDGFSDVIVGADQYDNGEFNEGAAFVYHGSASGINTTVASTLEGNQSNINAGTSVAAAGDINGDGYGDILIGADAYSNGESFEGAVFVHHGSASGINAVRASTLEENNPNGAFGFSTAGAGDVNGDGYADIVVGAYLHDNGQINEGKLYVYHGSSSGINTTANTTYESDQAQAFLGYSVSAAGDVNGDGYADIIVGAYEFDNGSTDEGIAYIFSGSSSGIQSSPMSTLESDQANAQFGISVSGAGDVNGDGISDVLIGSDNYNGGEFFEGAAFVFHGVTSGINTNMVNISKESNITNAFFGVSSASAGDVNGDGYDDWIVGASGYTNGQSFEGAFYLYYGPDAFKFELIESNQGSSGFGRSVAAAGDVNGDGYGDVIVGAPQYDNGQNNEGIAQIFHGSASGLSTITAVTLEGNQASAFFGFSVRGVGDINGDGYADVAVGASSFDNPESNEGVVFIYFGSASGINSTADDTLEIDQADAQLGRNQSVSGGDINGDGYSDVVVGASFYDNGQNGEGAIFVYHGSEEGLPSLPNTTIESNQVGAIFGESVAVCGDVNGDGFTDVLVGAIFFDNGQSNEGGAFVYHGSSSGLSTTAAIQLESNQTSSRFGEFVSGAGDLNGDGYADIVVGANRYDNGEIDEGAAFVYYGSESGIVGAADLLEINQASAFFGSSVAGVGDFNGDGYGDLAVGGSGYNNGQNSEGIANLYFGNSGGGLKRNIQLFNESTTNPISQANFLADSFNVSLFAKSFYGRVKGKLVWETMGNGVPFSSASPITNSTASTDQQNAFTDLGISGTRLSNNVVKMFGPEIQQTKLRVRIQYDPVSSLNGEVYSPWIYPPGYFGTQGFNALPLPIELLYFNARKEDGKAILQWTTASEINNDYFTLERSSNNGRSWEIIGQLNGAGNSTQELNYSYVDYAPRAGQNFYRLKQTDFDGVYSYSNIRWLEFDDELENFIQLYPNPAKELITVEYKGAGVGQFRIYDASGREVSEWVETISNEEYFNRIRLDISNLKKGIYTIQLMNMNRILIVQ